MTENENNKYFSSASFTEMIKRSFALTKESFNTSYLSKLLSLILVIVINILTVKLIEFILREIDLDPLILTIILIAIILVSTYITYIIKQFADGILYHSSGMSSINKQGGINSLKYSLKKINIWLLISLIILVYDILILLLISFIGNIFGDTGVQVFVWIYRIAMLFILPFFVMIIPLLILENQSFLNAIQRSFKLAYNNYIKVFTINLIITIVFFIIGLLFSKLFGNSGVEYFIGTQSPISISLMVIFSNKIMNDVGTYFILILYVVVWSLLYVLSVNLNTVLCLSILSEKSSSEDIYNKVKNSLEDKEKQ